MPVARPVVALLLVCASSVSARAEVEFTRVWPGARAASEFDRLVHYFGAAPHEPGVLRSQPAARAGYYWSVRYRSTQDEPGTRVHLDVIAPGQREPQRYTFPFALEGGSHGFLAGLTGADWPALDQHPAAWRVQVVNAAGHVLAQRQSFLWSEADAPHDAAASAPASTSAPTPLPDAPAQPVASPASTLAP